MREEKGNPFIYNSTMVNTTVACHDLISQIQTDTITSPTLIYTSGVQVTHGVN